MQKKKKLKPTKKKKSYLRFKRDENFETRVEDS